jgi:nucleotide-binding universal stress UspA family protein
VSGVTAYGTPASLLVETAEGATLLVVGSRGHGPVLAGLLGSVALGVTGHARCPVVVVRGTSLERPGHDHPVVVGVDGSAGAERALRHAADTAAAATAPLVVVTAWRSVVEESWYVTGGTAFDGVDLDRSARTQAEHVATDAAGLARGLYPELPVSCHAVRGAPAEALARAGASLLVVGSRGHGGLAALVLGSVTHALIHVAPCPVTVVPNR